MATLRCGLIGLFALAMLGIAVPSAHAARTGQLKLIVVEAETGKPLAARLHLKNSAGRMPRLPKTLVWGDHIVFESEITLKLPLGAYAFELECGPEYLDQKGHFEIADFADDEKTVEMKRFVNMAEEGWYSGDLDVERSPKDIELLMRADDLHVAHLFAPKGKVDVKNPLPESVVTFDENRCYVSGEKSGDGKTAWRDVRKASDWDLPLLVALGQLDSIELASPQLQRSGMTADEAGCKPRDKKFFPGDEGLVRWHETIYFHLLNCGVLVPPSAGSGSGITPNPVGYNRVYVQLGDEFSYEAWLAGLRAGRSIVTNGPMIRVSAEGEFPGHTFTAEAGQEVEIEVAMKLATRDKIRYLDIVQNGKVVHEVRLDEFAKAKGRLPLVKCKTGGWFLLRAIGDNKATYRYAMTAPYFVNVGDRPFISKASAQFFVDWVKERQAMLKEGDKQADDWQQALTFWEKKLADATAE